MATATKSKSMFSTRNDLAREVRGKMIALLNQQLADTFDLYSQTKQAHWNVKGAQFFQFHELFDKLAEELAGYVDLIAERATAHREPAPETPFHGRIADSVVPQIDRLFDDGWTGEEQKVRAELRKILDLPDLDVAATTVRVPVHTGHSVAIHLRTSRPTTVTAIEDALRRAPGLEYRPADGSERHPMPLDVEGRDPVLVGRLRAIPERERGFALFVASDNLRKGAALNAIQVAAAFDPDRFGCLLPEPR